MNNEKFNFYDSRSIKIYNLDKDMKYQLSILDNLDPMTKQHCENVGNLSGRICQVLHFNDQATIHIIICGYLHDIGKLKIPRQIIEKPSSLTDEEFEIMKTHTTLGYNICMNDLALRPYADGPLYHHEALNGTGYPQGLTKDKIPMVGQIIRIADEYDAITTKRHYTSHVNISEALKELIKDANPKDYAKTIALEQLSSNSKLGKINSYILRKLFKIIIDDILYEISSVIDYTKYLQDNIKRLNLMIKYYNKMNSTNNQKKKDYYYEGIKYLLSPGETAETLEDVLKEYSLNLVEKEKHIGDLYSEIKLIKKLKI